MTKIATTSPPTTSSIKTVRDLRFYSDAVPYLFNINNTPVSLAKHKPWITFYDQPARRMVVRSGRQISKSTNVGKITLLKSVGHIGFNTLYLSPLKSQTETWSHKKLGKLMEDSPSIAQYTDGSCINQVLKKTFTTKSTVLLSYYRDDPSRIRGDSNDLIIFDEVQNMELLGMDVVEEAQSASQFQETIYTGTALGMDNALEFLYNLSNQCIWVVPCKACNLYNKLDLENVGLNGLICKKCGKPIHNKDGFFVATKESDMLGLHIPQLAIDHIITGELVDGTRKWDVFRKKLETRTDKIIYNEMLGLPYGIGQRALTRDQLTQLIGGYVERTSMTESDKTKFKVIVTGVDYSGGSGEVKADGSIIGGESLHAHVSVGLTPYNQFAVLGMNTHSGADASAVPKMAAEIKRMDPLLVFGDGSGSTGNNNMMKLSMPNKGVHHFMYRGKSCSFKPPDKFSVPKTMLLDYVMGLLENGKITFPKSEKTQIFFDHILAEYLDPIYNSNDELIDHAWLRSPTLPDDLLHALAMAIYGIHVALGDVNLEATNFFLYGQDALGD